MTGPVTSRLGLLAEHSCARFEEVRGPSYGQPMTTAKPPSSLACQWRSSRLSRGHGTIPRGSFNADGEKLSVQSQEDCWDLRLIAPRPRLRFRKRTEAQASGCDAPHTTSRSPRWGSRFRQSLTGRAASAVDRHYNGEPSVGVACPPDKFLQAGTQRDLSPMQNRSREEGSPSRREETREQDV